MEGKQMDKNIIRAMAKAERMMDSGEIPYVWAPGPAGRPERLAVSKAIMEEFGLETEQTVNSIIRDAILEYNLKRLQRDLEEILDRATLDKDFDFRTMLGDDDVPDSL